MNKKIKTLLLALGGVIVLVAVLLALLLTKPEENSETEESSSAASDEGISLVDESIDDLKQLKITNESGTFEILPETTTETNDDGEEEEVTRYIVQELKDYSQSTTSARALINPLIMLSADSKVSDSVDDLSKYGLDKPLATAEWTCGDNSYALKLGMHNEAAGEYYFMLDGDEALYTMSESSADLLLDSAFSYIETKLTESGDSSTGTYPAMDMLKITRPDLDEPIVLEPYESEEDDALRSYNSNYVLTSPIHSELNYYVEEEYLPTLFGLSAEEAVGYYDEAEAANFGFDEPAAVLEMNYEGGDVTLTVGSEVPMAVTEDGEDEDATVYRYLLVNNNGLLYTIAESDLDFLNWMPDDLITTLPILPNIVTLSSLEVELDGESYTFDIVNEYDEESETDKTTGVSYNGEELDLDIFKKYYQLAISSSVENINLDDNDADPLLTITFNYTEGGSESIAFYPMESDSRRMQVAVNGELTYEGRIAYIEKVRTETEHLLNGETVDIDW